jgi:hypothetical protein
MKLAVNQAVWVRETLPLILYCLRGSTGKHLKSQRKVVDLENYISKWPMEFMAIKVLQGKGHKYRHDLESFFYVFTWMYSRKPWKGRSRYSATGTASAAANRLREVREAWVLAIIDEGRRTSVIILRLRVVNLRSGGRRWPQMGRPTEERLTRKRWIVWSVFTIGTCARIKRIQYFWFLP